MSNPQFRQITVGSTAPGSGDIASCTQLDVIQVGDMCGDDKVESIDFQAGPFAVSTPRVSYAYYHNGAYRVHVRGKGGQQAMQYYSPEMVSDPLPLN